MMNKIEFIANVRHIAWVAYQISVGQPYNEIPNEDQFQSLLQGVKFALKNPNMTSKENHDNWMKMKISQGWVYGPIKDFEKKTHPDLIPYEDLPEVERAKDDMDRTSQRLAESFWDRLNAPPTPSEAEKQRRDDFAMKFGN